MMKIKRAETFGNKMCGLGLIILGGVSTIPDKDATACVFLIILGICLFFEKKNVIG